MLKIENVVLPSDDQWAAVIRGMRNPKNSWDRSDSYSAVDCKKCGKIERDGFCNKEGRDCTGFELYELGPNDKQLAMALASGGPVHGKFRRMIPVYLDITAPLYWWKEFDTYKVGTVANSCSTMHKIHAKEFTLEDFSTEHLMRDEAFSFPLGGGWRGLDAVEILKATVEALNNARDRYLYFKDNKYWWQMIQLLPSSYNQKRTVMLNYEVLSNIYQYRRHHKLDEWHTLCDWIETLPHSELIFANLDPDEEDEGK